VGVVKESGQVEPIKHDMAMIFLGTFQGIYIEVVSTKK